MKNSMEFLQKIKTRTIMWPRNSTSGYLPEENKSTNSKDIYTPIFIAALFTISKIWKQPKCPLIDEWIKKILHTYIYVCIYIMDYYSAIKKNEILIFAQHRWPQRDYAKWNKSDRESQITYDFTYMNNLKNKANK